MLETIKELNRLRELGVNVVENYTIMADGPFLEQRIFYQVSAFHADAISVTPEGIAEASLEQLKDFHTEADLYFENLARYFKSRLGDFNGMFLDQIALYYQAVYLPDAPPGQKLMLVDIDPFLSLCDAGNIEVALSELYGNVQRVEYLIFEKFNKVNNLYKARTAVQLATEAAVYYK